MSVTLAKWGNALGIRIPAYVVKNAKLHPGDEMDIELLKGGEIRMCKANKHLKLQALLAQINETDREEEVDWGFEIGNEE